MSRGGPDDIRFLQPNAAGGERYIFRIKFDPDVSAFKALCNKANGPRTKKWIKDEIPRARR